METAAALASAESLLLYFFGVHGSFCAGQTHRKCKRAAAAAAAAREPSVVEGTNEHHKIEAIFKAFAKAIKMAVKQDVEKMILPSTKGVL